MSDTGPADTAPADTGPADTAPADTGPADTGPADTGPDRDDIHSNLQDDAAMSFVEHLRELRLRVRNAAIFVAAGFLIAYQFKQDILAILLVPLVEAWKQRGLGDEVKLIATAPTEAFWAYLNLSLWAGLFLASPFVFNQIWKFVVPGLRRSESRWGVVFSVGSAVCFAGGAVFCYFLVLSPVYEFLLGFASDNLMSISHGMGIDYEVGSPVALDPMLSVQSYLKFSRKLLLGFGLVFELPLAILILSALGIVNYRSLWRFNRWWIVLSFVMSAFLTPPDPASQALMAVPLIVLYNLSIGISFLVSRKSN